MSVRRERGIGVLIIAGQGVAKSGYRAPPMSDAWLSGTRSSYDTDASGYAEKVRGLLGARPYLRASLALFAGGASAYPELIRRPVRRSSTRAASTQSSRMTASAAPLDMSRARRSCASEYSRESHKGPNSAHWSLAQHCKRDV